MTRPVVGPWYTFGSGFQSTIREPYHDLEVVPVADGWRWRRSRIDVASGSFKVVASGVARSIEAAKAAAEDLEHDGT